MDRNLNLSSVFIVILRDIIRNYLPNKNILLLKTSLDEDKLSKLEEGNCELSVDTLYEITNVLNIPIYAIIDMSNLFMDKLNIHGVLVHYGKLARKNDFLLTLVNKFFNKINNIENFQYIPLVTILSNIPFSFCLNDNSSLVRYLLEDKYREWIDNGCKDEIESILNSLY